MKPFLLPAVIVGAAVASLALPTAAMAQVPQQHAAAARTVAAKSLLADLKVAKPDHSHRYQRDRFGYDLGLDADGDGCTTRKEVLIRDHLGAIRVSRSCAVYSTWRSLYDGRRTRVAAKLEIDHLVPLAEAWHAGAWKWSHQRQIAFGNDVDYPWDLQPVTTSLNQDKGDKDPAKWMPKKNRCTYAAAWVGVKTRWHLTVDHAEKATLARILTSCGTRRVLKPGAPNLARLAGSRPDRVAVPRPVAAPVPHPAPVAPVAPAPVELPVATSVPAPTLAPVSAPAPVETIVPAPPSTPPAMSDPIPTAEPVPAPTTTSAPGVYYANCTDVRAHGAAPLYANQPGYRNGLDRDGDGIACE